MKKELLPTKTIVVNGIQSGLFFALFMAGYDYFFTDESFSIFKFIFHFVCFGFFMAIAFRYKYTKET